MAGNRGFLRFAFAGANASVENDNVEKLRGPNFCHLDRGEATLSEVERSAVLSCLMPAASSPV